MTGRFVTGNLGAVKTGTRSEQIASGALAPASELARLAELRAEIQDDLGGRLELSSVKRSLLNDFLALDAIASWQRERLILEGCMTGKGKQRALLTAYLTTVDRRIRLAQIIGLERKARRVPSISEVMRGPLHGSQNNEHARVALESEASPIAEGDQFSTGQTGSYSESATSERVGGSGDDV